MIKCVCFINGRIFYLRALAYLSFLIFCFSFSLVIFSELTYADDVTLGGWKTTSQTNYNISPPENTSKEPKTSEKPKLSRKDKTTKAIKRARAPIPKRRKNIPEYARQKTYPEHVGSLPSLDTSLPAKRLFSLQENATKTLKPQAYGFYTRGCLAGGTQLAANGSNWQAMRLKRNRNWGHPRLVGLVKKLAIESNAYFGWPGLLVGDLSQPRGGPMKSGHRSHQVGLDADIWFTPMPSHRLSNSERESRSAVSVVKNRKEINEKVWREGHARLLHLAASYPDVARIFVHPPIKKDMCKWAPKGKKNLWLRKIRPYYGHHYHFHIRLKCPKGSENCKDQPPPTPRGDDTGCDEELDYWYSKGPWSAPPKSKNTKPKKPRKKKPMTLSQLPNQCRRVLLD